MLIKTLCFFSISLEGAGHTKLGIFKKLTLAKETGVFIKRQILCQQKILPLHTGKWPNFIIAKQGGEHLLQLSRLRREKSPIIFDSTKMNTNYNVSKK